MRALRWIIGTGTVVVLLVALAIAAGAVWLNTFIRSDDIRREIEARAGQILSGYVHIESVNFSLFDGLTLHGLTYEIAPDALGGAQGTIQLKAETVHCAFSWADLLHRRLTLTGLTFDQPHYLAIRQTGFKIAPPAAASAEDNHIGFRKGDPPITQEDLENERSLLKPRSFQCLLNFIQIHNGSTIAQDTTGAPIAELSGINAEVSTLGSYPDWQLKGRVRVAEARLPLHLRVTQFSTPFISNKGFIEFKPFSAEAYGGNLAGGYDEVIRDTHMLDLNGKGMDVASLMADTFAHPPAALSGSLDFQSKWRGVETGEINGEGDAQLTGGKLEGVRLLHDLSKILRLKELDTPDITRAQSHFLVADRSTQLTGLQVESRLFGITGDGTIGFDGALEMNLVLILSREAMGRLPKEAAASFVQKEDGTGSIAFHVTGAMADPQSDLASRLLLQNTEIKNVINKALRKFFH